MRRGIQKLYCKSCNRWQQAAYKNHRYTEQDENRVQQYHNEGLGTSAIGRLLKIPRTSVQLLMERKAKKLFYNVPDETQQVYLMDELQTFVGKNDEAHRRYMISIMNKQTGAIIETTTGRRRKEIIQPMVDRLLQLKPKRIETDGWSGYLGLIPKTTHRTFQYLINKLERFHLTIRQRIKRLSRKTMSFNKSERMLDVSVKLFCC